jgi:xanthine/uracil permease
MRSQALEHCILGLVVLVTLIWLDLLRPEFLEQAAVLFLAWAGVSTLLVASAGAWVAFARTRHAKRLSLRH